MEPDNTYQVSTKPVTSQPTANLPALKTKKPVMFVLVLIVVAFLLVLSLIFGYWSFATMLDYKNNSDKKSATAVVTATEAQKKLLEADFAEQEKQPLKTYTSSSQYGSFEIHYPKTWSAYITESASGQTPINAYFNPDYIPTISADSGAVRLRVQLVNQSYKTAVDQYNNLVTQNKLKASTFKPDNVSTATLGIRLVGSLTANTKGEMVIIPLRDKVLKIWTDTEDGRADLNNYILKNLTFVP
jgi:hypothetical protein